MDAYTSINNIKNDLKSRSNSMDIKIIVDDDIEIVANINAKIDDKKYVVSEFSYNKITNSKYVKYRSYFYQMNEKDQEFLLKIAVKFLTNKK